EYLTRPYEAEPGTTDRVLKESIEHLYQVFRKRPVRGKKWGVLAWHYLTDYFTEALGEVRRKWDSIEVDRLQPRPKVKVTGEFWLQTHEGDGNYNIKRWLEQEGAEVIPPPIAVWLDYLLHSPIERMLERREVDKYASVKVKGDAEVHALSRCQMILTEAKKRAQKEFDEALAKSGFSLETLRRSEAQLPEARRAGFKVPSYGCISTGANYVLHLAANARR